MILDHQHDVARFRTALRDWVEATVPADAAAIATSGSVEEKLALQRRWLAERDKVGLAIPHWPVAYGGAGLSLSHLVVMSEEFARADAPGQNYFTVSLNHVPATLLAHGTLAQKEKYLPMIPKGAIWCQGFSEPNAGSDLAALRTRAVRDGDHYVVNGQKTWSSLSMYADHCILLTRTDASGRKQQGITFLILDMKAPGVDVRPIRKSTGESRFAEIFLTDVRVPVADLVGEENDGWKVAQSTLASERGILNFEAFERRRYRMERWFAAAIETGAAWTRDPQYRREHAQLIAELQALRRQIRALLLGDDTPVGAVAMAPLFVKLAASRLEQRLGEFRSRVAGLGGQHYGPIGQGMYDYLESYGLTISGGSNEVIRNLIAERGLGMPR